jgi:hypothetical protein
MSARCDVWRVVVRSFGKKVKRAAKKKVETCVLGNMLQRFGSAQKVEMDAVWPKILALGPNLGKYELESCCESVNWYFALT